MCIRDSLFGQRRFAGKGQGFGGEGRIFVGTRQDLRCRVDEALRPARRPPGGKLGGGRQDQAAGQALSGFPAIEGVAVVGQEVAEVVVAPGVIENHRRREIAQQRGYGSGCQAFEDELLFAFRQ